MGLQPFNPNLRPAGDAEIVFDETMTPSQVLLMVKGSLGEMIARFGRCTDCGHNTVLSEGPGRVRSYRGTDGYMVPEHLAFPVCPNCGAQWLTATQLRELGASFEEQRARRHEASK